MSIPAIREMLYNPETPWELSPVPDPERKEFNEGTLSVSVVSPGTREFEWITQLFYAQQPLTKEIGKIYQIINTSLERLFEANLPLLELEASFTPSLKDETHSELRQEYLQKWKEMTEPLSPFSIEKGGKTTTYEHARLMFGWHGTNKDNFNAIVNFGLRSFGRHEHLKPAEAHSKTTDVGFFGGGIYLTDNPEVASNYGNCLVLTLAAMRTPFPIVGDIDCNYPREPSDVKLLKGLGGYKNYNTHFAPIKQVADGIYYPCSDLKEATAHEIVIFERCQALPLFWVELIVALIKNPVEKHKIVRDLITLLKQYQKKSDEHISNLLERHIKQIEKLPESTQLTDSALQVYEWAIRFFEGKEPPLSSAVSENRRSLGRAASAPH